MNTPINLKLRKFIKLPKTFYSRLILACTIAAGLTFCYAIYWNDAKLPPEFPLYYSLTTSEEQLAGKGELMGIPIIVGTIVLVNSILGFVTADHNRLLSKILFVQSLVVLTLTTITLMQIGWLIT